MLGKSRVDVQLLRSVLSRKQCYKVGMTVGNIDYNHRYKRIAPFNYTMLKASTIQKLNEKVEGKEWKYLFFAFPKKSKRSVNQNAYYWVAVVKVLAETTGYSSDIMHEYLKKKFLGVTYVAVEQGEQPIEIVKSSKDLNKEQFWEYCERIRKWAYENIGVDIPDPEGLPYSVAMQIEMEYAMSA